MRYASDRLSSGPLSAARISGRPARLYRAFGQIARVVVLVLSIGVVTACGGSGSGVPTGPTPVAPSALDLQPGTYWLELIAITIADRPMPTCQLAALTSGGTWLTTPVRLERVGGGWHAVSPAGSGSLELWLRPGVAGVRGVSLTGRLQGTAIDVSPLATRPAYDTRVEISGPENGAARIEGTTTVSGSYLSGEATGVFTFADANGETARCPSARWGLQRATTAVPALR